jgi:hypothetical protein
MGSLVKLSADHALKFSFVAVLRLEDWLELRLRQERHRCRPEDSWPPALQLRVRE